MNTAAIIITAASCCLTVELGVLHFQILQALVCLSAPCIHSSTNWSSAVVIHRSLALSHSQRGLQKIDRELWESLNCIWTFADMFKDVIGMGIFLEALSCSQRDLQSRLNFYVKEWGNSLYGFWFRERCKHAFICQIYLTYGMWR